MSEMEDKLGAILGNPQMMQQIMAMAQSMNQSQQESAAPETQNDPHPPALPAMDPALLGKLAGLLGQSGIDRDQRVLLKALSPYLSTNRIQKLEKAMQAAKLARMASVFLSQGGLAAMTGR